MKVVFCCNGSILAFVSLVLRKNEFANCLKFEFKIPHSVATFQNQPDIGLPFEMLIWGKELPWGSQGQLLCRIPS